jgi:hypothetical protein
MDERLIRAQAIAARIASARMSILDLAELHDSVERACGLAGRSQWDRKPAAHTAMNRVLG